MDCVVIGFGTAEGIGDFLRRAELVDRRHGEDGATFEVEGAGVSVFVEEGGDDFAGEIAIFAEVISLLHLLGTFLAGERLLVVSDVADEIERIEDGADFLIQRGEDETLLFELLDDGALLVGLIPWGEEVIERGVRVRTFLRV